MENNMNRFKLNYKNIHDVDFNLNEKNLKEITSLSLAMTPEDLPVLAFTLDLSNVEMNLDNVDIDIKLNSLLPSDLQEIILKDIKEYYSIKE